MRLAVSTAAAALLATLPGLQPAASAQSAFPRSSLQPSPYTSPSPRAVAGAPALSGAPSEMVRVNIGGPGGGPARQLALPRGKSAVIELPTDAKDVVVADSKVADVVLSTPRRIYVMGLTSGQTDAAFFDASGRTLMRLDIRVDQDVSAVSQTLARVMPSARVHVEAVNQSLILSGEVASPAEADRVVRIASSFVAKPEQIVNMLAVGGSEQVMLKVKVVEVNRSIIKQLGFNTQAVLNQIGEPQYLLGFSPTYAISGALLGGLTGGYSFDSTTQPVTQPVVCPTPSTCVTQPQSIIDRNYKLSAVKSGLAGSADVNKANALIQAFERVGLVRTLAEPNLTAVSGESARFLAGGEFPVPTAQDNNGRVTVEFKPFGVGLGFTPVVLSGGRISLKISSEVSEVTNVNSFSLGSTSTSATNTNNFNLVIPGLTVRRTETVVELPSGGAMMIAGLLQSKMAQNLDGLPGLLQLPVLGSLFRSRDFLNNETELAVIVTPYLVKPVRPDQLQTPADGLQIADDITTNLLGRLNKGFGKPASPVAAGRTYQGPYGYVVE